jgi:hypothetical membrane protein
LVQESIGRTSGPRPAFVAGAACWIVGVVQYFAAQFVVAAAWKTPYSVIHNFISDLGNTQCGMFAVPHGTPAYVCSPLHGLMNASFCLTGVLTLAGVVLLWHAWPPRRIVTVGLVLLVIAGVGKILVGLAPENGNIGLHLLGAFNIPLSGVAILLLSIALWSTVRWLAVSGLVLAVLGLVGSFLSIAGEYGGSALYLGLGVGGTERLAGYPGNLWTVLVGVAIFVVPLSRHADGESGPSCRE